MAKITITVSDLEVSDDTYRVDFAAEGSQIEEGRATAAYFTGYYLHSLVNTPDFINGVIAFGRRLIEGMEQDGHVAAHPTIPSQVVLTLQDKDLNTGRYVPTIDILGGDRDGNDAPTSAQVIGLYMRSLLSDAKFRRDCWEFAEQMVRDNDMARIPNAEFSPTNDDDADASAAA